MMSVLYYCNTLTNSNHHSSDEWHEQSQLITSNLSLED